jgi:DNA-binding MarR family transcriptional regulator
MDPASLPPSPQPPHHPTPRNRRTADSPIIDRAVPPLTDDFTAWLITSLAVRLNRGASSFYSRNWGIGTTEYRLVMELGQEAPCTAVKAAAAADIDKAAASRSMQVLAQEGIIEMTRRGREMDCDLTESGRELATSVHKVSLQRDRRLTHGFEPEELERLRSDLRRLIDNLAFMNEG